MAGVLEKLLLLNDADLSKLARRIAALRAKLDAALKAQGENPNRAATAADIEQAARTAGLTVEQLMEALETAKRRGLL